MSREARLIEPAGITTAFREPDRGGSSGNSEARALVEEVRELRQQVNRSILSRIMNERGDPRDIQALREHGLLEPDEHLAEPQMREYVFPHYPDASERAGKDNSNGSEPKGTNTMSNSNGNGNDDDKDLVLVKKILKRRKDLHAAVKDHLDSKQEALQESFSMNPVTDMPTTRRFLERRRYLHDQLRQLQGQPSLSLDEHKRMAAWLTECEYLDQRLGLRVTPEQFSESMSAAADVFVGPELSKQSGYDKAARKRREAARNVLAYGRQALAR